MPAGRLPLEGVTVVAIEQAVAAPFCSSRLADAGARVIKVERPEGLIEGAVEEGKPVQALSKVPKPTLT